jgi:hypothetical protein
MKPSVIVWDLETVPDLGGFAAANDLVGKSDVEVREAIGDKFRGLARESSNRTRDFADWLIHVHPKKTARYSTSCWDGISQRQTRVCMSGRVAHLELDRPLTAKTGFRVP